MTALSTGATTNERALRDAAAGGDEHAFGALVEPYRGELHAHCYRMLGSVQDAEDAAAGGAAARVARRCARFEGRSSLRSWLYTIATNTCLNAIARRPKRVLPIDHGPPSDAWRRPRAAAGRVGLARAVPGRAARRRGRPRGPRGPLRAARERRARVHRRRAAPARDAARRADPARGARLLGPRGRRVARDHRRVGQQRAAARPRRRSTSACPSRASRPPCARSATTGCARSSRATWTRCSAATSTASSAMLAEDAAWSMPPLPALVRRPRGDHRLPRPRPAVGRLALAPPARPRQRAGRDRRLRLERGGGRVPAVRARRADARAARASRRSPRSSRARPLSEDPRYFERYPEQPLDPERTAAIFGRLGLPDRLQAT